MYGQIEHGLFVDKLTIRQFIGTLTNQPTLAHAGLTQISQGLCAYKVPQPGRPDTILIDTPGFDTDKGPDAKILEKIIDWLAETYASPLSTLGMSILIFFSL